MRAIAIAVVLASGMLVIGAAQADSGEDLAKSSGCLGCHAVDTKKVGPAYKDVAKKFKGKSAGRRRRRDEGRLGTRIGQGIGQGPRRNRGVDPEALNGSFLDWERAGAHAGFFLTSMASPLVVRARRTPDQRRFRRRGSCIRGAGNNVVVTSDDPLTLRKGRTAQLCRRRLTCDMSPCDALKCGTEEADCDIAHFRRISRECRRTEVPWRLA